MDRGSFHNDRSSPTRYLGRDGIIRKRYVASSMNRFEDGEKNGESVLDFFFISPSPFLLFFFCSTCIEESEECIADEFYFSNSCKSWIKGLLDQILFRDGI